MSTEAEDEVLAPVAFDRARLLSRLLVLSVLWYTVAGGYIGLPMTTTTFTISLGIIAGMLVIVVGTTRRYFSERAGHTLLGLLWVATTLATLQGLILAEQPTQALLIIVEILGISVLLHTRFVIMSLAGLDLVYVPYLAIAQPPGWGAYLTGALGAQVLAFAFHRVFRAAMLEVERRRHAQAEAATALQHKLAEIESSRAAREALAHQLAATERIEATGTLAASFAHQMNNILTGITMTATLLSRRAKPEHRADYDVILTEGHRGSDLTRALLAFSRRSSLERQAQDFDEVVRTRCDLIARMLPRTIQLDLQLAAPIDVSCDVVQIGQLLMNLAMNAADASDGRGTVVVETSVVVRDDDRFVRLCVRDRGRGMSEATKARVFDPFFTTKRGGKGMGLPTAWGIARAHDGTIEIESVEGEGTTVAVQLPAVKGVAS